MVLEHLLPPPELQYPNKVAYTPVVVGKSSLCLKTKASVQQGHLTLCGCTVLRVHHSGVHNAAHHKRNFRRNISVAGFLGRAT